LYNLIRNAIQASPAGDTVVVEAKRLGPELAVSVEDHGPGIPPDVALRMFDPFYTTKQAGPDGGMGLGLSVSRSLIDAMGGRIEVSSEEDHGSVFTAVFPSKIEN
jgi:signal transduction histidine kinase